MTDARSPLASFLPELERLVDEVALEDGPSLLGDLERIRAKLWLRLTEASRLPTPSPAETSRADRLLTADEAAEMLGVTPRWVYDHAHEIPARVQLPGRVTRFSQRKLEKWIRERSP